jgi:hypothetical protein
MNKSVIWGNQIAQVELMLADIDPFSVMVYG